MYDTYDVVKSCALGQHITVNVTSHNNADTSLFLVINRFITTSLTNKSERKKKKSNALASHIITSPTSHLTVNLRNQSSKRQQTNRKEKGKPDPPSTTPSERSAVLCVCVLCVVRACARLCVRESERVRKGETRRDETRRDERTSQSRHRHPFPFLRLSLHLHVHPVIKWRARRQRRLEEEWRPQLPPSRSWWCWG